MPEMDPVLAKRQLQDINRGLSAIQAAVTECDVAENCGVDCEAKRESLENARQILLQFKATYFPEAK